MRNVSHKAAATIALGLLTDDLFGALVEAPMVVPESEDRLAFAEYVAAGRWLGEIDRSESPATRSPRRTAAFN